MKLLCAFLLLLLSSVFFGSAQVCKSNFQDVTEGVIQLDPYPVPIGTCQYYIWNVTVDGASIDVKVDNLDLDGDAGDYLIIGPGPSLVYGATTPVMTGKITSRNFRLFDRQEMVVMLVIQTRTEDSEDFNGIKITYKPYGEAPTEPPSTTPQPIIPSAPSEVNNDATLYVGGIKLEAFVEKLTEFKEKMAAMADSYCEQNNIQLSKPTPTDNVLLDLITSCPSTWPDAETCTKIHISLPVFVESSNYELTRFHIEDMWKIAGNELATLGMEPYSVPDADEVMMLWVYIAIGVVAVFATIMIIAWKANVFTSHKKGSQFGPIPVSQSDSITSWVSSLPSYIDVPPIFDIETVDKYSTNTGSNTLSTSDDIQKPKQSQEYQGVKLFGGYSNPAFDFITEEGLGGKKDDHVDDFSSDEEMHDNTKNVMTRRKSTVMDETNESAL